MNLIKGETVTVIRSGNTFDELGEPIEGEPTTETVGNVIVAPSGTDDMDASRPAGITVDLTLCFPKSYAQPLKGCSVVVRGKTYDVIGDPEPYTADNIYGDWNLTVEVTRSDG